MNLFKNIFYPFNITMQMQILLLVYENQTACYTASAVHDIAPITTVIIILCRLMGLSTTVRSLH